MDIGTLTVHLSHAQDLKDVDKLGKQDPYCWLSVGNKRYKSKTHTDGGKHPSWNESFQFSGVTASNTLRVELYDKNVVFSDKLIGTVAIPLKQVCSTMKHEVCAPVTTGNKKLEGELYVNMSFRPSSVRTMGTNNSIAQKYPQAAQKVQKWVLPTYGGRDCWADYVPGRQLGKGTFGTTYLATSKSTNETCAIKVISKRKLVSNVEEEDVKREVEIMHHLTGHPNVVAVKDIYEDRSHICLVMELCEGGELFESIHKRGHYTERDAAALVRTIVSVVDHCHKMNVVHRDLKPENFLWGRDARTGQAQLKATDFGLSTFFKDTDVLDDIVGSPYYVAPEVLRRRYGKEADIWSCGVILYILLCGYPPFNGTNTKAIFEAITNQEPSFAHEPWPRISEPAKDCVRRMLVRDPRKRATADQILKHDWLRENGVATDRPLQLEVLDRINRFTCMNKFKKQALKIIASSLPVDEINGLKQMFIDIDKDKSGTISVEEFANALRKKGQNLTNTEIQNIITNADLDGDGVVDYEEFLAATINQGKLDREENLIRAFGEFDVNGDGRISRQELTVALGKLGMKEGEIRDIVLEVDQNGDGEIDYQEFCIMMRSRT